MENFRAQEEINDLRERVRHNNQLYGEHPVAVPPYPGNTGQSRSLAERIDDAPRQTPLRIVTDNHGRVVTIRENSSLPPTVVVRPINIHPRFLPLGSHFQEGGDGRTIVLETTGLARGNSREPGHTTPRNQMMGFTAGELG